MNDVYIGDNVPEGQPLTTQITGTTFKFSDQNAKSDIYFCYGDEKISLTHLLECIRYVSPVLFDEAVRNVQNKS